MLYSRILIVGILWATSFHAVSQDLTAITSNGKSVTLKKDGTWKFKDEKSSKGHDFRKVNWGMSKLEVKATESGTIVKDDSVALAYEGNIAGLKSLIAYFFVNDLLVRAKYIFIEDHSNDNDFISDYDDVFKILNNKYGEPAKSQSIWKDDLYKSDFKKWGLAISLGHLVKFAAWKTADSDIWLGLDGDNFEISHSVEYSSIKLDNLEKEKKKKMADSLF